MDVRRQELRTRDGGWRAYRLVSTLPSVVGLSTIGPVSFVIRDVGYAIVRGVLRSGGSEIVAAIQWRPGLAAIESVVTSAFLR